MVQIYKGYPNKHLRQAREERGWSQTELADLLEAPTETVSRWERGERRPGPHYRQKLCKIFGKTASELDLLDDEVKISTTPSLPAIWTVPYRSNQFFTGRKELFERLHDSFHKGHITALSGLGGVGKTQLATEYAYRYSHEYQAILWVDASSRTTLLTEFAQLANALRLPESHVGERSQTIDAVTRWLSNHTQWLLILDDIKDMEMISDLLPSKSQGHVLFTTRTRSVGDLAQRIELAQLSPKEGALFLLRRTKIIMPQDLFETASLTDRRKSLEVAKVLDGLPLAIDQAAAYIKETECGITGYLNRYQKYHQELLKKRGNAGEHPESVAITWKLSFGSMSLAARELLQLCAFFHSDAIPEEFLLSGSEDLGLVLPSLAQNELKLDAAISELLKFSLIRRIPNLHIITIHSLVQAILIEDMDKAMQRLWAMRAVQAVNHIFPDVTFSTWPLCQRCLPHALACSTLITNWNMTFPEAARVVDQAGSYLRDFAQLDEAKALHHQALLIREATRGSESLDAAKSFWNLAVLSYDQGNYDQAEQFCQQALDIREHILGSDHSDVAQCLDTLADIYIEQNKYTQAEALFKRAHEIFEQILGPKHIKTASVLKNLAVLYDKEGNYEQSEPLYQQALTIYQQASEDHSLKIAECMNNLGWVCTAQGRYGQAEFYHRQTLAVRKKMFGSSHPEVATSHNLLGRVYQDQARYEEAEFHYKRALRIRKKMLRRTHPDVAGTLNQWGELCRLQGNYEQAESFQKEALVIYEQALARPHRDIALCLNGLARVYCAQERYSEAELIYQEALSMRKDTLGEKHSSIAISLNDLADLRHIQGQYEEAVQFYQEAQKILETATIYHPFHMAVNLSGQAATFAAQGQNDESVQLYQRALEIYRGVLGPKHPRVIQLRESYVALLQKMQ